MILRCSRYRTLVACAVLLAAAGLLLSSCASLLPVALHTIDPDLQYRVGGAADTLYLTLDDGPSPATGELLEVLKRHGVRASFFVVSAHIEPEAMRRIVGDGHALGHHMKTTQGLGGVGAGPGAGAAPRTGSRRTFARRRSGSARSARSWRSGRRAERSRANRPAS